MNIKQITFNPRAYGYPKIVIHEPSQETATLLLKERLNLTSVYDDEKIDRSLRKIPKKLRGFINPFTKVTKQRLSDAY